MTDLPSATLRPRRRWSGVWLLPLASAILVISLLLSYCSQQGIPITIAFQQGHGLKSGDALRYRGIRVGEVEDVFLTADLQGVSANVRLLPSAQDLARTGSRFWVVRPQVDLSGVTGLDTVIGAHYLGVLPGGGDYQDHFIGLEQPPVTRLDPGGLTIVLATPGRDGLRAGAPVSYRDVPVGTILSVELSADASAIAASIYIKPAYSHLIRTNTRFWKTSGVRLSAGLSGIVLNVNSLHDLLLGGISLATPPEPGPPAVSGQRFVLHDEADKSWLAWQPSLPAKPSLSAPHPLPQPQPVVLSWQYKNMLQLTRISQREGWALPVVGGLLGPANLLSPPARALSGSVRLALSGQPLNVTGAAQKLTDQLLILTDFTSLGAWQHARRPQSPEDTWVTIDPNLTPRFVAANRYRVDNELWLIDDSLPFASDWHGASVVAQRDGALLGLLLIDGAHARVALLNDAALTAIARTPIEPD